MAQFGSALEWGSRGRKFKSSYPDQYGLCRTCYEFDKAFFFLKMIDFLCFLVSDVHLQMSFII